MSPDDLIRLRHVAETAEQALAFVRGWKRADLATYVAGGGAPGDTDPEPEED